MFLLTGMKGYPFLNNTVVIKIATFWNKLAYSSPRKTFTGPAVRPFNP